MVAQKKKQETNELSCIVHNARVAADC